MSEYEFEKKYHSFSDDNGIITEEALSKKRDNTNFTDENRVPNHITFQQKRINVHDSEITSIFEECEQEIKFWKSRYEKLIEENIELKEQVLNKGGNEENQILKQENDALLSKIKSQGLQLQKILEENEALTTEISKISNTEKFDFRIRNNEEDLRNKLQALDNENKMLNQKIIDLQKRHVESTKKEVSVSYDTSPGLPRKMEILKKELENMIISNKNYKKEILEKDHQISELHHSIKEKPPRPNPYDSINSNGSLSSKMKKQRRLHTQDQSPRYGLHSKERKNNIYDSLIESNAKFDEMKVQLREKDFQISELQINGNSNARFERIIEEKNEKISKLENLLNSQKQFSVDNSNILTERQERLNFLISLGKNVDPSYFNAIQNKMEIFSENQELFDVIKRIEKHLMTYFSNTSNQHRIAFFKNHRTVPESPRRRAKGLNDHSPDNQPEVFSINKSDHRRTHTEDLNTSFNSVSKISITDRAKIISNSFGSRQEDVLLENKMFTKPGKLSLKLGKVSGISWKETLPKNRIFYLKFLMGSEEKSSSIAIESRSFLEWNESVNYELKGKKLPPNMKISLIYVDTDENENLIGNSMSFDLGSVMKNRDLFTPIKLFNETMKDGKRITAAILEFEGKFTPE